MVVYITATILSAVLMFFAYRFYKKSTFDNLLFANTKEIGNYKKNNRLYLLFFILSIVPLVFISGLRWGVGTDYFYGYYPGFYDYFYKINTGFEEGLYNVIIDFISLFSNDSVWFFIFTSLIFNSLLFISIKKMSKNWIISVIMIVAGNFFFISLNNVRQACAMAAATVAFAYACEKKLFPFILFAILTYMLHNSSIVMIVPCAFILLKKVKKLYPIIAIGLLCLTPVYFPMIKWILSFTKYADYFKYTGSDWPLIPYIVIHAVVFAVSLYMYKTINEDDYGFALMLLNLLALIISIISIWYRVNETMSRGCLYFSWSIIFLVPYFMKATRIKWLNISLVCIVILVACVTTWFTSVYFGHHEVFPYRFIFAKDWLIW